MTLTATQIETISNVTNSSSEAMILRREIEAKMKKMSTAYIIGFFLGGFGGHRFYLGQVWQPILQLVLSLFGIGIIWVLADVYFTKELVIKFNDEVFEEAISHAKLLQK